MKLSVLLGDAYKEGMTADEIISALERLQTLAQRLRNCANAVDES